MQKKSHRNFVVFTSLIGTLTLTSALLLALAPAPLTPDASGTLLAVESAGAMEAIFHTRTPVNPSAWKYIYIHHSRSPRGNAQMLGQEANGGLGDHFVIGNGQGALDGEIQIGYRWDNQTSPAAPAGAASIDPACISICLSGDFDSTVPTPTQLRSLTQLVSTLQSRLRVGGERVLLVNQIGATAGIGRYFPTTAFREQLLP